VSHLSQMADFLKVIRRGRPASPELVEEMTSRYQQIGGSPLLQITEEQARSLSDATGLPCTVAMRLWEPRVEGVLTELGQAGITRACVVPLAPFSVDVYVEAARAAQRSLVGPGSDISLVSVGAWGTDPAFVAASAAHIERHLPPHPSTLLLTAHSLPMRAIQAGDRYAEEVERSFEAVVARLPCAAELVYQSQGADGGDWLGSGLRSALEAVAARGERHVTLAPFGFLSDHVETLYDLDIEAMRWCRELGLGFTRVPALNTDPDFIRALARLAQQVLA
jgi:protoporphyrin/coproporphyrin ferrochelatase